jgi:iron-sulfur cluster assembly protein
MSDVSLNFGTDIKPVVSLTDSAANKVKELIGREDSADELVLRVAVQPGGCSGMRYALYFDQAKANDVRNEFDGVAVCVDPQFAPYLQGTTVDWVDSLQGAGFSIDNPNAQNACGCGQSFS